MLSAWYVTDMLHLGRLSDLSCGSLNPCISLSYLQYTRLGYYVRQGRCHPLEILLVRNLVGSAQFETTA